MKKGFTLIELLAVIIILAILMIIAVPNILSTLATARSSAFITQAESLYKAAEQQYIMDVMTGSGDTCYDKNNLNLGSISSTVSFVVQMNSTNGTVQSITITDSGGQLTASGTSMNGIALTTYNSSTLSCSGSSNNNNQQQQQSTFGGTFVAATTGQTHKGVVYLDPKSLTSTCTAQSTITTTNTGCKKFYIFDDSGDSYKMIMDRNTTNKVAWNSTNSNSSMSEVTSSLSSNTSGWSGNPRLITMDEIASIVGAANSTSNGGVAWTSSKNYVTTVTDVSTQNSWFYFDGSGTTYCTLAENTTEPCISGWQTQSLTNDKSSYIWLYDYTRNCTSYGCDNADADTDGYWTSTPRANSEETAWFVTRYGYVDDNSVDISNKYGVRPVIEIAKTAIPTN